MTLLATDPEVTDIYGSNGRATAEQRQNREEPTSMRARVVYCGHRGGQIDGMVDCDVTANRSMVSPCSVELFSEP
jgi:hypothetical protein